MKSIYTTTTKYVALAFSLLLAACTTDLYDEDKETPIVEPEEKGLNIPDDFDFATISTRTITVNIMDEYNGQKYYMLEGYDDNPVFNPSATLLFREKTKGNVPCVVKDVVFANTAKNFYIRQTDPYGLKTVYAIPLEETDNLVCDLKPAEAPVSKASVELRSDFSSIFEVPNGITKISNVSEIQKGGTYCIPERQEVIFSKNSFPKDDDDDDDNEIENVTLYIAGTLKLEVDVEFKDNCQLIVLEGGKIIGKDVQNIEKEGVEIVLKGGSDLYNEGNIDKLKKLSMDENEESNHCILYNKATIRVHDLEIDGTDLYNDCLIKVEDEFELDGAGSNLYLNSGALICNKFEIDDETSSSSIHFEERAIFKGEKAEIQQVVDVYGVNRNPAVSDADRGIFYFNKLKLSEFGSMRFFYAVEIVCTKVNLQDRLTFYPPARLSGTEDDNGKIIPTITIEPSNCNDHLSNNPDKEDQGGGGSTDIKPGEGYIYTYLFEDNWPSFGDYDMNDLVVDIDIANQEITDGNAKTAIITATLQAVGATKDLYVFVRASNIEGEEVALFDGKEAHACFGLNRSQMINTDEHKADPFTHQTTVNLKEGKLSMKELDVFIVWGDPSGETRNEIHLVDIEGTKHAAISPTSVNYRYKDIDGEGSKYNNMVWGVMILQSQQKGFKYPKELNSIMDVYPDFVNWARSHGENYQDWYERPQGSVYDGN